MWLSQLQLASGMGFERGSSGSSGNTSATVNRGNDRNAQILRVWMRTMLLRPTTLKSVATS